jgi:hypothetical protein
MDQRHAAQHKTYGFMSIKKPNLKTRLLPALRHNKRTIQAELGCASHIDAARTPLNVVLRGDGSPEELHHQVQRALVGVKARRDAPAIEVLFSLPAESEVDPVLYFEDCTRWAERHFGCPIISSDIHFDEAHPHCHVLLLPIVEGKLQGSRLVGYRWHLQQHQDSLHAEVGVRYGLPRHQRLGRGQHAEAVHLVLHALKMKADPIMQSAVWPVAQQSIELNPVGYLDILGIPTPEAPGKPKKSFTQIMISPGKGPKWEPEHS